MRLLSVMVSHDNRHSQRYADIVYTFVRQAADLKYGSVAHVRFAVGKGVIDCSQQKIMLWTMGTLPINRQNEVKANQCPKLTGRHPEDAVIACTGR
jgi:hypothetical protein